MTRPDRRPHPRNLQARSTMAGEASAAAAEVESALTPPLDPTAAAFFDVDNTVMQGASIFHLARGLYRGNALDPARFFASDRRSREMGSDPATPRHSADKP